MPKLDTGATRFDGSLPQKETDNKIKCARCSRTLLIGELQAATFTMKCKKCGAVNLIQVHPHVTIKEINPALMVHGKVMSVSLPMTKSSVEIVKTG